MRVLVLLSTLLLLCHLSYTQKETDKMYPCTDKIFCGYKSGDFLHTIQMADIFPDSKTFVDMKRIASSELILQRYEEMMKQTNRTPTKNEVLTFVNTYFAPETDLKEWKPSTFNFTPAFLKKIPGINLKNFAQILVYSLASLGRRVNTTNWKSKDDPSHSLLYLPFGFYIPGGRFQEMRYWDSYHIVEALLICDMEVIAQGILRNFRYEAGDISTSLIVSQELKNLNAGSRKYFHNRAHPPFWASMVAQTYIYQIEEIYKPLEWSKGLYAWVIREFHWWRRNRIKSIKINNVVYEVPFYGESVVFPRPEGYRKDVLICDVYRDDIRAQKECYKALHGIVESGWDYSTRWTLFDGDDLKNVTLANSQPQRLIPVDLTAILCQAYRLLEFTYNKYEGSVNQDLVPYWKKHADKLQKVLDELLYDPTDGIWYDYDLVLLKRRKTFYASNFMPLYTQCFKSQNKEEYGRKAAEYYTSLNLDSYWGVPSSLINSGQQWDFPNAFAPMQEYIIFGLHKTGNKEAKSIAKRLAYRWITSMIKGYGKDKHFYDRYDVTQPGTFGSGGEYPPQIGYGWTIAVTLKLIEQFPVPARDSRNSKTPKAIILNPFVYVVSYSILLVVGKLLC